MQSSTGRQVTTPSSVADSVFTNENPWRVSVELEKTLQTNRNDTTHWESDAAETESSTSNSIWENTKNNSTENSTGWGTVTASDSSEWNTSDSSSNGNGNMGRPRRPMQGTAVFDEKAQGYKLFVGGLNSSVTQDAIERAFSAIAKPKEVFMKSGSRPLCFVTFENQEDGNKAGNALNDTYVFIDCFLLITIELNKQVLILLN